MQRWYEQPEETVKEVPSITTPANVAPTIAERRYDMQTMQRAVEIASRMQAEHEVTLSTQEIEAIATEAGIEPRFIHQALTLAAAETVVPKAISVSRGKHRSRRRLSRRTRFLIFGLPLIYSLLLFLLTATTSNSWGSSIWPVLLILVIPELALLFSAASLRRVVQGACAGLMMGFGICLAIVLGRLVIPNGGDRFRDDFFLYCASFVFGGTLIGATTTFLWRKLPHWIGDKD